MLRLAIVGFGAIGQELARMLQADGRVQVTQIVTTGRSIAHARGIAKGLAPDARVSEALDVSTGHRPDLLAECAGHAGLVSHVIPALRAGVACVVASVGALADADVSARIEEAAALGGARVRLISGAIGALDALDAARFGGLDRVLYTGRKPPRGWAGTAAEDACDLATLSAPCVVFQGSARDAATRYPKNANVAATVALAGLGLDRTEVQLIADPAAGHNIHRLQAWGAFGSLELRMENLALPTNPRTSALTVYSLARAVLGTLGHIAF